LRQNIRVNSIWGHRLYTACSYRLHHLPAISAPPSSFVCWNLHCTLSLFPGPPDARLGKESLRKTNHNRPYIQFNGSLVIGQVDSQNFMVHQASVKGVFGKGKMSQFETAPRQTLRISRPLTRYSFGRALSTESSAELDRRSARHNILVSQNSHHLPARQSTASQVFFVPWMIYALRSKLIVMHVIKNARTKTVFLAACIDTAWTDNNYNHGWTRQSWHFWTYRGTHE
jgi:hypothetical protein